MKKLAKEKYKEYFNSKEYRKYFREELDQYAELYEFSEHESLMNQGIPSNRLYFMFKGSCKAAAIMDNGKSVIVNNLIAPCLIGEIELINEESPFHVETREKCVMAEFIVPDIREILLNDSRFLFQLCYLMVEKERRSVMEHSRYISYPLENRLAKYILEHNDNGIFRTRKTIVAESLGVSYRHTETVMKNFVEEGILKKVKLTYFIVKKEQLDLLADELTFF